MKQGNRRLFLYCIFFLVVCHSAIGQYNRGLNGQLKKLGQAFEPGNQYLVLIGIDKYVEWNPLKNPVKDLKEIGQILNSRYYFDKTIELFDESATKEGIVLLFTQLQSVLKPWDSLLIMYSGHGHLDKGSDTAFWIPVNGGLNVSSQENWIPMTQVRGYMKNMNARHILLISDSCFSGDILSTSRSINPIIDNSYFSKAYERVSRQVLTSGASEIVPDESDFALQLKIALKSNQKMYFDPLMLFDQIRLGVKDTTPLYGELKNTGHQEGGSFLLFLREDEKQPPQYQEMLNVKENEYSPPNQLNNIALTLSYENIIFPNTNNVQKKDMVLIEGGNFIMGDTHADGYAIEKPAHEVSLSPYYIACHETTRYEWFEIMDSTKILPGDEKIPMDNISWFSTIEYCNKKSQKEGLVPCYVIDGLHVSVNFASNGYRLPTEAEWEFAARGGTKSNALKYVGSNDPTSIAWYSTISNKRLHEIGSKLPNELGLYDLSGNVMEWCWDWFSEYKLKSERDPSGPVSGILKVTKGGSAISIEPNLRPSYRQSQLPSSSFPFLGFRVVLGGQ